MSRTDSAELLRRARSIELVVLDVDGVLTDGGLYYGAKGEMMKRFDVRDGHGIVLGRIVGLRTAVLTARRSTIVDVRAKELQIHPVRQGEREKRRGLDRLLREAGVRPNRAAYMGDDVNDLGPLEMVELAACPSDAASEVERACHFVAQSPGGAGAVRELFEFIIMAQGKWKAAMDLMRGLNWPLALAPESRKRRRRSGSVRVGRR
jgi:3-deoxy-D-manno-octulosonate 8-phosphate phosphatase (KDO 8-P phosphatase)